MINFTVDGEPKGKGRPRFTRQGHCYTPPATQAYEELIAYEYQNQVGKNLKFAENVPLKITILAWFGVPKSYSKKKRAEIFENNIKPTKKPDCDNIVKIVLDGLNGVAYYDDKQVVWVDIVKRYSDTARLEVFIEPLDMNQPKEWEDMIDNTMKKIEKYLS